MENRRNILDELRSVGPTLAEIAPVNPYSVPAEYFEKFASQVLVLIKDEKASAVLGTQTQVPYQVPGNYFQVLPDKILALVKRHESSLVLPGKTGTPYMVPENYFDDLAGNVLARVKSNNPMSVQDELEALSPLLSKLDKRTPFSTPAGYFDAFGRDMMSSMSSDEPDEMQVENLSPLMTSLRSANVYEVPSGYFQNLPQLILRKVKNDAPARVVSMTFGRKMMRYAAAAVVAGVIFIGGWLLINRQGDTVPGATVAQTEEIQRETQAKVEGLSDDELAGFLDQTISVPDILVAAAVAEIDTEDVKMMLADIPDEELKKYLVEYGDEKLLTN